MIRYCVALVSCVTIIVFYGIVLLKLLNIWLEIVLPWFRSENDDNFSWHLFAKIMEYLVRSCVGISSGVKMIVLYVIIFFLPFFQVCAAATKALSELQDHTALMWYKNNCENKNLIVKKIKKTLIIHTAVSCPRDWWLSASWGPNEGPLETPRRTTAHHRIEGFKWVSWIGHTFMPSFFLYVTYSVSAVL